MSKSIAVFGAGPGLGEAVACRYAREGYGVTLVARRPEPLERLAKDLTGAGATAHVITAGLADTDATPGWPSGFALSLDPRAGKTGVSQVPSGRLERTLCKCGTAI